MTEVARPLHRYSYADYLTLEEDSPVKHEFYAGEIYAMAGGTPEHTALAMAVATVLGRQLSPPCRLFSSDLRVRVLATGLTTYPDLSIICGKVERDPVSPTTAVNPKFLVEVTSPGTEEYDRGEKLEQYQRIPSLESVLIVSHRAPELELWSRENDAQRFIRMVAKQGERLVLLPFEIELAVDEVYAGVIEGL